MLSLNKLAIGGGVVAVLSVFFGFYGFWYFVERNLMSDVTLGKDTDIRKVWEKAPISVDFNVYIFNVTNFWEVQNGSKPIVEEIGPFVFNEWKEKVDIVDHDKNDSVSFHMKNTWYFDPDRSGSLTLDTTVAVPHIAMLGLVYMVEKRKPGSLRVADKAIPALYNDPRSAFLTTTVRDLLFDGNVINCTSTAFAPSAICSAIRSQSASLHQVSEDIFKFSLFGVKNGTAEPAVFTVLRGLNNHKDVGRVVSYNHESQLLTWDDPECNKIRGTDSTIFPALQDPEDDIVSFSPDLCRSLGAKYQFTTTYEGISAAVYNASLGDMSSNPEEKCYCPAPDKCLKKGAMDLTECLDSPIIVTLPHFYDADSSYLEGVEGLHPSMESHQIILIFEPITGTPLSAKKRLQFNIYLHPVSKVKLTANLPSVLLPIFWVEEGLDLSGSFVDLLKNSLFKPLHYVAVSRWVGLGVGLAVAGFALGIKYMIRRNLMPTYFQQITPAVVHKSPTPTQVVPSSPT